jgi:PAS domain S-box-containing protein
MKPRLDIRPTVTSTRSASVLIGCAAFAIIAASLSGKFSNGLFSYVPPAALLVAFSAFSYLIVRLISSANHTHRETISALDLAERKYKSVFDNALDAIIIFSDDCRCLDANPAAHTLFGTAGEELLTNCVQRLLRIERDVGRAGRRLSGGRPDSCEARFARADGRNLFVEYTISNDFLPGLHAAILRDITRKKESEIILRESDERFQEMSNNIQEVFWMFDVDAQRLLHLNAAFETITGRTRQSMGEDLESYAEIIHPDDRPRILSRLSGSIRVGAFDEEFRICRPDGTIRWIWCRSFPVQDSVRAIRRLVGTAQDITVRKTAEEEMVRNFDLAEAARAEAEALRKASLALSQNLSMDHVLDALLEALLELIPCELAQVILVEAGTHMFLAREVANYRMNQRNASSPETFDGRKSRHLVRVCMSRDGVLLTDTAEELDWPSFDGFSHLRSWLSVPLVGSKEVLGLLALGDTNPKMFTREHLRLANSLAVPAAVAIQNARLYEQAEIFRSQVEQRLAEVQHARRACG